MITLRRGKIGEAKLRIKSVLQDRKVPNGRAYYALSFQALTQKKTVFYFSKV